MIHFHTWESLIDMYSMHNGEITWEENNFLEDERVPIYTPIKQMNA